MINRFIAVIALLGVVTPVQAHQIWIEQSEGQNAVVRFGELARTSVKPHQACSTNLQR